MPVEPQLNLHPQQASPPDPPPRTVDSAPTPAPIWLQRTSLLILVLFCIQLGVILTGLPWIKSVWDENGFLLAHPQLLAVLKLGPVRGIISGLGLLDIWIGISEAIHYSERAPSAN